MLKRPPPVFALLLLLLIGIGGLNLYWLKLDTRPHAYTDGYVEKTMNLADGLRTHDIWDWPRLAYWATIGPRPSLYQSMAAPFVLFVERSPDAMLIVNTLFMMLLGLVTYKVAAMAAGPMAGFWAALMVSTYPLTLQLATHARPHALLPAATALVILSMMLTLRQRTWPMAWLVAGSLFFIFSIHAAGMILLDAVVAVFCVYTAFFHAAPRWPSTWRDAGRWILAKLRDPFVSRGLIPAMGALLVVVTLWMILKWEQWLALKEVGERIFAPMYSFWDYEQTLPRQVSWFFAGLLLVAIAASIVKLTADPKGNRMRGILILALISLFAMAHLTGAVGWPTFAGILPLLAIVTAIGLLDLLDLIKRKWPSSWGRLLSSALLGATAMAIVLNYAHARWGLTARLPFLGAPHLESCTQDDWVCPRFPHGGDWQLQPLLGAVVADPKCLQTGCRLVLISKRPSWFSDEALSYGLVQFYPDESRLPSQTFYPQRTVQVETLGTGPGGILNWLTAEYLVFLSDGRGQSSIAPGQYWGNKAIESALVEWLFKDMHGNQTSHFGVAFEAALPSGAWVTLARRDRDFTPAEVRAIIAALPLPEESKQPFYADLDDLTDAGLAGGQGTPGKDQP